VETASAAIGYFESFGFRNFLKMKCDGKVELSIWRTKKKSAVAKAEPEKR
jgi:hypothetical protein